MRFDIVPFSIVPLARFAIGLPYSVSEIGTGVTIPMTKYSRLINNDGTVNFGQVHSHTEWINQKIQRGFQNYEGIVGRKHPSYREVIEKRVDNDVPLDHGGGFVWFGEIAIGTPAKEFKVVFDTASTDLFIPSIDCIDLTCQNHAIWNPARSRTAINLGRQVEVGGSTSSVATVNLYNDTIYISDFVVTEQTFGAAITYSTIFRHPDFLADGVMGMGFPYLSAFRTNSVFANLILQGQINNAEFSFLFSDDESAELYLGGYNSELLTGEFTFVPVMEEGYWEVDMDDVLIDGHVVIPGSIPAIIETGTPFIYAPLEDVVELYGSLSSPPIRVSQGHYAFPYENGFPMISLSFGGTPFPISPEILNVGKVGEESPYCFSGLVGENRPVTTAWLIGEIFLRNVYSTFDMTRERVGFARLPQRAGGNGQAAGDGNESNGGGAGGESGGESGVGNTESAITVAQVA